MSEAFAAGWLALREPADRSARSADLARRFLAATPAGGTILDLAAGTGANTRYLQGLDGAGRRWRLVDADGDLLGAAHGLAGRPECRIVDLATEPLDRLLDGVAGVTASAFIDIVSLNWLAQFAVALAARGLPVLMALSVDGRIHLDPPDPGDADILARFAADQERDKGFGPAAGPHAPAGFARMLADAGYDVALNRSDWRLSGDATGLAAAYLRGLALDADGDPRAAAWLQRRLDAAASGRLDITAGHIDLLGQPRHN
ncbi:MAG: class I SAM-dependent methyltransferase [Alphaproteobacteria bacterium]